MLSNTAPALDGGYLANKASSQDLQAEYAQLRDELEHLLTNPVKDFQRIDALVDRLELVQLAFKEQHGIKGNNPNE